MRSRLLVVCIAALLAAGCAAPGPVPVAGAPTPGCPNTAWDSFRGITDLHVPSGMTIAPTSRTGVLVTNTTTKPWTVRVDWWSNMMCFGWSATEGVYTTAAAGSSQELTAHDPGVGSMQSRIGVIFWDHARGNESSYPATGFAWVEVPQASASN